MPYEDLLVPGATALGTGLEPSRYTVGRIAKMYYPQDGDREALAVRLCEEGGVPLVMWRDGEGVVAHCQDRTSVFHA